MFKSPSPSKARNPSLNLASMFDTICNKVTNEMKGIKTMEQYFKDSRKFIEQTTKSILALSGFHKNLPETSYSFKTASEAIGKELELFSSEILNSKSQIEQDIIEPLEVFKEHFEKNCSKLSKQGINIISELSESRKQAEKEHKNYLSSAEKLEKTQLALQNVVDSIKNENSPTHYSSALKEKTQNVIEKKTKHDQDQEKYKNSVSESNKTLELKMKEYDTLGETLLQLDESRVGLMKSLLTKHVKYMEQIAQSFISKITNMKNIIECINAQSDTELFVSENENLALNPLFIPLEYEPYAYKNPEIEAVGPVPAKLKGPPEESKGNDVIRLAFEEAIICITDAKALTIEQRTMLIEYLHKNEGREAFADILSNISRPMCINSIESFRNMSEIVNYLLNTYMMDSVPDDEILTIVINVSRLVYCIVDGKKQFLYSAIYTNSIWQDIARWRELINLAIQQKVEELQETAMRRKAMMNQNLISPESKKSIIRRFKKAFGGIFASPEKEPAIKQELNDKKLISSAAMNVLFYYTAILVNYRVKTNEAKMLVRYFGKMYGVEKIKLCEAELDLMILQPLHSVNLKTNMKEKWVKVQEKIDRKYKGNLKAMILAKTIKFINDKQTLRNIMLLSKEIKEIIRIPIFKQVLAKLQLKMPIKIRGQIWSQILETSKFIHTYSTLITSLKDGTIVLPKSIEDVISLDVQRSFAESTVVDPIKVKNVLRAYACCNHKVEYCQGMNFVAGFLYYMLQDEEKTFQALGQLIAKYNMDDLFAQDVPLLKKYFYQMDRLLFLHMPNLAEHLKSESVGSAYFASTWFMTLFTNVFLYAKSEVAPNTLLTIWDEFLIHGWKSIFRAGLYICKELEMKLMELKFDEIMMVLSEVSKTGVFHDETANEKLVKIMGNVKIRKSEMKMLVSEYDDTFEKVNKFLEEKEIKWSSPEEQ